MPQVCHSARPKFITAGFIKRCRCCQSDCNIREISSRRRRREKGFAMSFTMKVSMFLYALTMYVIAAGRSGLFFPL